MKETNIDSSNKLMPSSYGTSKGVFLNTDENLFKEIVVVDSGICHILPASCKDLFKDDNEGLEVKESEQNKVTEDFALKLVAMVSNKEKFNDLK